MNVATQWLVGTRVVLLDGPLGATCARLLGSLGAEVTCVASPGSPWPERIVVHPCRRELLDLDRPDGMRRFEQVMTQADFLLEALAPDYLLARGFRAGPHLIHASLSVFGATGPYAKYRGSELVASAMGGVLRATGYPDRPPVKEALDACGFHAELACAAAMMVAHVERATSGLGQHVDISVQEVAASRTTNNLVLWQFDRRTLQRSGVSLGYGRVSVRCVWELADGYAFHTLMSGKLGASSNAALSGWMGESLHDNPLRDVDWLSYDRSALPADTRTLWEAAMQRFFATRTRAELQREAGRRGIHATVVQNPADVLSDPQLVARAYFLETEANGGKVRLPGSFVRARGPAGSPKSPSQPPKHLQPTAAPLAGLKVLDLSWALLGSLCTKALADFGADVVKIESSKRLCLTRTDVQVARSTRESFDDKPWFVHLNTGKRSLRLDLKHPRVREVLDPLLAWCDVLVENFSPGTLDKLGLDYATLSKKRPELIMVSGSVYGQTGPLAQSWGVDGTGAALSGRLGLTGWPDRPPITPGSVPYGDVIVPQVLVTAALAALVKRQQTGLGCHIDGSMVEVCVQQMAAALALEQLGQPLQRSGNRAPELLLQGVYKARGDQRFIAISVFDARDWRVLCELLGGHWPTAHGLQHADTATLDALDARIAAVTAKHDDYALMLQLQARGIAAGVVQDARDILERDPQLRARGAMRACVHPVLGSFAHPLTPYHLSRSQPTLRTAPLLGEHTRTICRDLLGMSEPQYASLSAARLFE